MLNVYSLLTDQQNRATMRVSDLSEVIFSQTDWRQASDRSTGPESDSSDRSTSPEFESSDRPTSPEFDSSDRSTGPESERETTAFIASHVCRQHSSLTYLLTDTLSLL